MNQESVTLIWNFRQEVQI